ncbi:MAG: putative kinase inhibitor prophage, partial [Nitrospirota bacterium]|nr:putative kinase inhibitor prophage [Nitrospirota bacterium]
MRSLVRGMMILAALTLPDAGFAVEFSLSSPTIKDHSTIGNDHV